jgi:hypothetical protein
MKVGEIWIWIGNPDLDSGRPKFAPKRKKRKKFHVLNSLNVLFLKEIKETFQILYITVFDQKNFPFIIFFTNFVVMNLGLDTDPDWLLIQQQAGSGSGYSKIPGSVTGPSEYGSETLEGNGTHQTDDCSYYY